MDAKLVARRYEEFVLSNTPAAQVVLDIERLTASHGWRFVLFGGSARDIALEGRNATPRDLDVVVDGATQDELQEVFKLPNRTFFGGLKGPIGGIHVDMWPLEKTWAFTREPLDHKPTFSDLMGTTPFNIENIAIEPTMFPTIYEGGFFSCMAEKTLEISCQPNVDAMPELTLIRAARFCKRFGLTLGPALQDFVYAAMGSKTFNQRKVQRVQRDYYGTEMLSWLELSSILAALSGYPCEPVPTAPKVAAR